MRIEALSIPTPFPVGPINCYLIVDRPLTLVDTGPKTEEAKAALVAQLSSLGFGISDIGRIILTHTHEDHCGLASWLQEQNGAVVYVHEWEEDNLTHAGRNRADRELLRAAGVPGDELETMVAHYARVKDFADPVARVKTYREGEIFEFEGGSLLAVHTPGHTPGSCCLLREATRTLLAGDTVIRHITPNPVLNPDPDFPNKRFPSLINYLDSLERLREIAPTLIKSSHGTDVTDFPEYLARLLRHTEDRQKKVIGMVGENGMTGNELAGKLFPGVSGVGRFLAISEALAHLDLAVRDEHLRMSSRDGVDFFYHI